MVGYRDGQMNEIHAYWFMMVSLRFVTVGDSMVSDLAAFRGAHCKLTTKITILLAKPTIPRN